MGSQYGVEDVDELVLGAASEFVFELVVHRSVVLWS